MSTTPIKVSVIIPVYNASEYLKECLDSLLSQTLENIEVICVDDGSTDQSLKLLNDYSRQDGRVIVLEQKNQYAGAARNRGLTIARGEYVIFLDADDFFDPQMLELACASGDEHESDLVLFGFRRYDDKNGKLNDRIELPRPDLRPKKDVFSAEDIPDDIFRITTPAPWTKLFRHSFISQTGLQFQTLPNSNDLYFTLSALALAKRISVVDQALTFYRVNMASSTQGQKHKDPCCFLQAVDALYHELKKHGIYSLVERGFHSLALSTTCYNLSTIQTDASRYRILDALSSPLFQQFDLLDHDREFYANQVTYEHATMVSSAIAQYKRIQALKVVSEPELIVPYRGKQPILVSVIIPVYNTEHYLGHTLASICRQSLKDIEIICINDGSTDNSLDSLKQWAAQDDRISVYSKSNAGLSHTRNVGIHAARGSYVYFMDSDDILAENALEELYAKASREQLDIIYFDASTFFDDDELNDGFQVYSKTYARTRAYDQVYTGPELFLAMRNDKAYQPSACLQMLRRAFLLEKGLSFHVGIIHEDNGFTFASMLQAERVSHVQEAFFHRRMRRDSIMTSSVAFKNAYGYFVAYQDMISVYSKLEQDLSPEVRSAALALIGQILVNAQNAYCNMPIEQRGSEFGLGYDYSYFDRIVKRSGLLCYRVETQVPSLQERLKRTYAEKSEINAKLSQAYKDKSARGVTIKEQKAELHKQKATIKEQKASIKEQKAQLKQLRAEKKALQKELKALKAKHNKLKKSLSYRIGRYITWPFRKLKALFSKK